MTISDEELELANKRGEEMASRYSPAVEVRYDETERTLIVTLKSGIKLIVPAADVEGLHNATADQLREVEISPSGLGFHFPAIDADIYLPGLLAGTFGTKRWMAARTKQ